MSYLDEDDCDCEICTEYSLKENKMAKKDFVVQGGYYFDTLDEAVADAKKRVAKGYDDLKVYQAVKIVSTTTPNVEVKDYAIA